MKYLIILVNLLFFILASVSGQTPQSAAPESSAIDIGFADPRPKNFSAQIWINGNAGGSIKARQWTRLAIEPGEVIIELEFSKWSSHKNQKIKVQSKPGQESYIVYSAVPASLGQMPLSGGGFATIGTTHGHIFEVDPANGKKLFDTFVFVRPGTPEKKS